MRLLAWVSPTLSLTFERRRGGGKAGKSGGSKSKGGAGKSTSAGITAQRVSTPNLPGGKGTAYTYGSGGGVTTKPNSGLFKGYSLGGGTRTEVYGTSVYGSGYPQGYRSSDLPYYYYPVVWSSGPTPYPPYLNRTDEYGHPTNSSRPGGPLVQASLHSNTTDSIFHFLADNSTAYALLPIIRSNCSIHGNLANDTSSSVPVAYIGANTSDPLPIDAVQYYRASSAVLTLEGYDNTAALSATPNATVKSMPADVDSTLLTCLNVTIGAAIPLVNSSQAKYSPPGCAISGFVLACLLLLSL